MNCKKMLSTNKILLILLLFVIFWYALNTYFKTNKVIEGNRKNCGKKKAWCETKKKCVSIWGGKCDAKM